MDEPHPVKIPPEEVFELVHRFEQRTQTQSRRLAISNVISAFLAVLVLVMVLTVSNLSGTLNRRSAVLSCVGQYQHALAKVIDGAVRNDNHALDKANEALLAIECTTH